MLPAGLHSLLSFAHIILRRESRIACSSIFAHRRSLVLRVVEFEVGANNGPLRALEKGIAVSILVSSVLLQVGVLPQINANDRHALDIDNTVHEWVVFVVRLGDAETAIFADSKPDPAWQGTASDSALKSLFEAIKVSEKLSDGICKWTERLVFRIVNRVTELAEHQQVVVDAANSEALLRFIEACRLHVL